MIHLRCTNHIGGLPIVLVRSSEIDTSIWINVHMVAISVKMPTYLLKAIFW